MRSQGSREQGENRLENRETRLSKMPSRKEEPCVAVDIGQQSCCSMLRDNHVVSQRAQWQSLRGVAASGKVLEVEWRREENRSFRLPASSLGARE